MNVKDLRRIFADNIRAGLAMRGMSQSELARRCGWAPSRVGELLASDHEVNTKTIQKVADAFGLNESWRLLVPACSEAAVA